MVPARCSRRALPPPATVSPELIDRGFPMFIDYYGAHIADGSRAFPGLEAALDALDARGVRLAVCTNKLEGLSRTLIETLGWRDRFVALVGGDTLPVRKPDPAPLLECIARAGGGRAAFVGDSITDTDTARVRRHPVHRGDLRLLGSSRSEQLGADMLIDHYDALIPALEELGSRPLPSPVGEGGSSAAADG